MDDRDDAAIFKAAHDAKKRAEPPHPVTTRRDAVTDILSGGILPGRPVQKPANATTTALVNRGVGVGGGTRSKPVRPRVSSEQEAAARAPRRLPHSVTQPSSRALATHTSIELQPDHTTSSSRPIIYSPRKPTIDLSPTNVATATAVPHYHHRNPNISRNGTKIVRDYTSVSARKNVPFTRGPTTTRKSVRETASPISQIRKKSSTERDNDTNVPVLNIKTSSARKTVGSIRHSIEQLARKTVAPRVKRGKPKVSYPQRATRPLPPPKTEIWNGKEVLIIESSEEDKTINQKKKKIPNAEPQDFEPSSDNSDNETIDLTRPPSTNEVNTTAPQPTSKQHNEPPPPSHPYTTYTTEVGVTPSSPEPTPLQNNVPRSPPPPPLSPSPPTPSLPYQEITNEPYLQPTTDAITPPVSTSYPPNTGDKMKSSPFSPEPPSREEKSKRATAQSSSDDSSSSSDDSSSSSSQRTEDKSKDKERRAHLKKMQALVKHYLEVLMDSGNRRKVLVLEYLEDSDIHFVRFLDEAGGSVRVNLSTHDWRKLDEEEITDLQESLGAQAHHDPSRPDRTRVQPKRRRPPPRKPTTTHRSSGGSSGGGINKRRRSVPAVNVDGRLGDVAAPGGEIIGATIAIRWPGNGEMFVALVVGCRDEGLGKRLHKIYYIVDESTEVIDLNTRHWVRNGPGCDKWDTSGLVGRRVVVLWDGVYDGEAEDTPLRPIPYEAFVVKYIENFRYRLLYTQGDSLEDRDMSKNTDSWELCEHDVWKFEDLPLVSWSNVAAES